MSRHSPKEIERIKRIAASADFGKPVAQGSLATPTLLACPFCGGKPNIVKLSHRVTVMCCCKSNGAPVAQVHAMTEEDAVAGWNTRT